MEHLGPGIGEHGVSATDVPVAGEPITEEDYLSSSGILVTEKFNQAKTLAEEAWKAALAFLDTMTSREFNIPWTYIAVEDIDGLSIEAVKPSSISLVTTDIALPEFTAETPEMADVETDIDDVPDFTATEPVFNIPDPLDLAWPTFTKEAPEPADKTYPVLDTLDLPDIPTFTAIVIPDPMEYNPPEFEGGDLPTLDAEPPTPSFVWNEAEYSTDVLDALEAKILNDVINGGTGLDEETEQAIYDRARSRQVLDNQDKYDEALNYWSSRGHPDVPGALNARLARIRAEILRVLEDLENDILVNQSKLAQENTHFIIAQGIAYEKALMDHSNQVQQRAFDAAKYTVEYSILLYDVKVKAYLGELEAYKTYAQVFESRIRAEIAKAEFYKAQIEGARLVVEVQQAQVSLYRAQIDGINAMVGIYNAQLEAIQIQAQIDKLKIDGYAAEVQAFAAKNTAYVARYNAYEAEIRGETEKAKIYVAQAQAYEARVSGYKAKADVEISRVQVEVETLKGKVSAYLGQIDKYKADIQGVIAEAELLSKEQGHQVDIFRAESTQYGVEVDAMIKEYLGRIEELKANVDLQIKEADISVRALIAEYDLTQKSLDAGAKIASQLAASALGSVSASAHLQHGQSRSDSRGYSAGWSANTGITESHKHDETKGVITTSRSEHHEYNPGERMFGVG